MHNETQSYNSISKFEGAPQTQNLPQRFINQKIVKVKHERNTSETYSENSSYKAHPKSGSSVENERGVSPNIYPIDFEIKQFYDEFNQPNFCKISLPDEQRSSSENKLDRRAETKAQIKPERIRPLLYPSSDLIPDSIPDVEYHHKQTPRNSMDISPITNAPNCMLESTINSASHTQQAGERPISTMQNLKKKNKKTVSMSGPNPKGKDGDTRPVVFGRDEGNRLSEGGLMGRGRVDDGKLNGDSANIYKQELQRQRTGVPSFNNTSVYELILSDKKNIQALNSTSNPTTNRKSSNPQNLKTMSMHYDRKKKPGNTNIGVNSEMFN